MARAQAFPPNETGVTMGHWHLNTRDIEANKKIFVAIGGTAIKAGNFEVVRFPGVLVYLHQNNVPPPTGGTVGSVVNHVGFIVQNIQEATTRWKAAGVPVLPGNNGRTDQAFVVTPDELRDRNPRRQGAEISHPAPSRALLRSRICGSRDSGLVRQILRSETGMRGQFKAADLPGVNLSFSPPTCPRLPRRAACWITSASTSGTSRRSPRTRGRRHQMIAPTRKMRRGGALAFIYDPWGTYIELNERPNAEYIGTR